MKISLGLLPVFGIVLFAQVPAAAPKPVAAVTYPVLRSSVPAEYTPEARAAGLQGTVYLYVQVDADGTTSHVQVLHGLGLGLDEKAVAAVKRWRYSPATQQGQTVTVGQSAEVKFRLDGAISWRIQLARSQTGYAPGMTTATDPVLMKYVTPSGECGAAGSSIVASFLIEPDGVPSTVVAGAGGEAVVEAIKQWRYKPGEIDGHAKSVGARVEFGCGPSPSPEQGENRVGSGVTAPVPFYKPEPNYSMEAWLANVSGAVRLSLVVDELGYPKEITVIGPFGSGMDEKSMASVLEWRFKPGLKDGKPASIRVTIEVKFRRL